MKSVFFVMCLALISNLADAQSFFTLGANYSTTTPQRTFPFGKQNLENFRLSPSLGYGYNFQLNEKWSYQPGIYLSDLGSIKYPKEPMTSFSIWAGSFDQFIDYKPLKWFSIALSPSVYYVGRARIITKVFINERPVYYTSRISTDVNWLVFSMVPRVSFHLKERWSLNLSYRNDLMPISFPAPFPRNYKARGYLGYGVGINLKYQIQSKKPALPTLLSGQPFFTVGANYSTTTTRRAFPFGQQKLENFKLTPSIGFGYNYKINEKWSYQPGLSLGDAGSIRLARKPKVFHYIYTASLDQFIDYKPLKWFSLAMSPSVYYVGYAGITAKTFNNNHVIANWKPGGEVNRLVFSIVPRVSFHMNNQWSLNLFYRYDLTPIGFSGRLPPGYQTKGFIGYGVGLNLKYQLQ